MTTFNEREKGFENKFIHDKELGLKVRARRDKLLGQWIAEKLGKKGPDAEQYAVSLAVLEVEAPHKDIVTSVLQDLKQAGITSFTAKDIRIEMERFFAIAQQQIEGSAS